MLQIEEQYIGRNKTQWAREEGGSSTFSTPAACPSRVDPALGPLSYIIICGRNKTVARYHAIQQNKPQRFITSAEANVENILLKQMIVKKQ